MLRNNRKRKTASLPVPDPAESARQAGLRYVSDDRPGILRGKAGRGFLYIDSAGKRVRDRETLERIAALAIPPAWTSVWICPSPNGHLQATGRDAKGRKQYRYHPDYRTARDDTKYSRMTAFGKALPQIRKRVREHLALQGLPQEKVLAAVVRLLETTLIRVGNEEYAKENDSYGLTTLRNGHVKVRGSTLRFRFRGKSGKEHEVELNDPRLARIVKRCQDLPGEELFQYEDEEGVLRTVSSDDVNEYLRQVGGQKFTAKDFRTWNGTVLAACEFGACDPGETKTAVKKNIAAVVKRVAERLRNRPATCRKYYLHPAVLDAYSEGSLLDFLKSSNGKGPETLPEEGAAVPAPEQGLSAEERCVLKLLESREQDELSRLKPAV